jgi:hypothetical protein
VETTSARRSFSEVPVFAAGVVWFLPLVKPSRGREDHSAQEGAPPDLALIFVSRSDFGFCSLSSSPGSFSFCSVFSRPSSVLAVQAPGAAIRSSFSRAACFRWDFSPASDFGFHCVKFLLCWILRRARSGSFGLVCLSRSGAIAASSLLKQCSFAGLFFWLSVL